MQGKVAATEIDSNQLICKLVHEREVEKTGADLTDNNYYILFGFTLNKFSISKLF